MDWVPGRRVRVRIDTNGWTSETPGIVVTGAVFQRRWTLTHAPTGFSFGCFFDGEEQAMAAADALGDVTDWLALTDPADAQQYGPQCRRIILDHGGDLDTSPRLHDLEMLTP